MGIFSKTEEEIREEELQKKYKLITSTIYNSNNLSEEESKYLIDYVNNIRRGYTNDFDDIDTLFQVMLRMVENEYDSLSELKEHFEKVISCYHQLVNKESKDYPRTKERFIEMFIGEDGLIYRGLFDPSILSIFQNKEDYFEIMNVIRKDSLLTEKFELVKQYITSVCKYCLNQDVLKRDIISFLNGFSSIIDENYEGYINGELENAKRRVGIYNISPKDLAEADTSLRRVGGYLDRFEGYMRTLSEERNAVSALIEDGKKKIQSQATESIETLKRMIEEEKALLIERLDAYLLDLEEALKAKSDETFRSILETYKSQVAEFKRLFQGYSVTASKDLLAIQKATEESVLRLQNYVSTEPQLQSLLNRVEEQGTIRQKIVELVAKEEELAKKAGELKADSSGSRVIIPGYEQVVMVPYRRMVLPEKVDQTILPAFDTRIPFEERLKVVEQRLKEKEASGEIFHKKIMDIVVDLMEGDWPYLYGPSGTGKTYLMKQAAKLLGMKYVKAGKITEKHSLLGYNDPQGRYMISPTFVAVLYGQLLLLDELDNGNPDTIVVCNDIFTESENKINNPEESFEIMFGTDIPVEVHPNFRMISAGNTSGEGENSMFSSRGKLDESILERVTSIYIDYDDRVDAKLLEASPAWHKFSLNFRKACLDYANSNGLETPQGTFSTRDACALKKYIRNNSKSIDQIIAEKYVQIKDSECRKALGRAIAAIYGLDYQCSNPNFDASLREADEKTIAKKFVYYCREGVR